MKLWGRNKKGNKAKKKKSVALRKRQPTREERLRAIRNRKIFALIVIISIICGSVFYGYHIGAFTRFKNYTYAEFMRISADAGFRVDEILVTGRDQIDKKILIEALTIKRNMPIFGLDIKEAKAELEKIIWVNGVTISRVLPNVVFVDLNERKPVALWQQEGEISLVDKEGVVLNVDDLTKWSHLPIVVGKGAIENLENLVFLLEVEPVISDNMVSATRIGERRWDFRLDNGILIKLPENDIEFALRRLVKLEKEKGIFSKNVAVIDLRKPERMVVELAK